MTDQQLSRIFPELRPDALRVLNGIAASLNELHGAGALPNGSKAALKAVQRVLERVELRLVDAVREQMSHEARADAAWDSRSLEIELARGIAGPPIPA